MRSPLALQTRAPRAPGSPTSPTPPDDAGQDTPRSTADVVAGGADEPELMAALALPWWRTTLPLRLERRFLASWNAVHMPRMLLYSIIGLSSFLALSRHDLELAPHDLAGPITGLHIAVVAVTSVCVVISALLRRRRTPAAWLVLAVAQSFSAFMMAAYIIVLAHVTASDLQEVGTSALVLVLMYTMLVARLPLVLCLPPGAVALVAYDVLAHWRVHDVDIRIVDNNTAMFLVAFVFTAVVRLAMDRSQRRAWVLRELDVLRRVELTQTTEQLRNLALHDALTGLGNRRAMAEALTRHWSGPALPLALIAVDIDHFKAYNDAYGHPAGDACLSAVAHALQAVAQARGGLAARMGGEEFTLLLPGAAGAEAADAAQAVCAAVRALALPHGHSSTGEVVTVSVGATSVVPSPYLDVARIHADADAALYRSKRTGRDRWCFTEGAVASCATPQEAHRLESAGATPTGSASAGHRGPRAPRRRRGDDANALREEFWEQAPVTRQRRLSALVIGMAPIVIAFAYHLGQLEPDVAGQQMRTAVVIEAVASGWSLLALRLRMRWRGRVLPVVATVIALGAAQVVFAALSTDGTSEISLIPLFLLPMFLAFVVNVPLRYVAGVTGLLLTGAVAAFFSPHGPATSALIVSIVSTNAVAMGYSLIGGRLLQRMAHGEWVLHRHEREQYAVLAENSEQLAILATVDPLTTLVNRRGFDAGYERLWQSAAATGAPLALLILDVDHFKRFNDTAGHPAGDDVLRSLGQALAACAAASWPPAGRGVAGAGKRAGDAPPAPALAARLGGEEFSVVVPGATPAEAEELAEHLRSMIDALALPHPASPVADHVTVSIGVAAAHPGSGTGPGAAPASLLAAADAALYRAKEGGRNRVAR